MTQDVFFPESKTRYCRERHLSSVAQHQFSTGCYRVCILMTLQQMPSNVFIEIIYDFSCLVQKFICTCQFILVIFGSIIFVAKIFHIIYLGLILLYVESAWRKDKQMLAAFVLDALLFLFIILFMFALFSCISSVVFYSQDAKRGCFDMFYYLNILN